MERSLRVDDKILLEAPTETTGEGALILIQKNDGMTQIIYSQVTKIKDWLRREK
jgi:hypothetical protein